MDASAAQERLIDRIVDCMRGAADAPQPAVVDVLDQRVLAVGAGPAETHVSPDAAAAVPQRYCPIPTRERIEAREHVAAFIHDYIPNESYLFDQAEAALARSKSAGEWRSKLGERHRAVIAFDAYMDDFYHVMARMVLHGTTKPRVGLLGNQKELPRDEG